MKHNYTTPDKHDDFFEKVEIPYTKSKEEVWTSLLEQRKAKIPQNTNVRKILLQWSLAASVALLLGAFTFLRYYSITLYAPAGEHIARVLPDNSKIHLNANTKVTYNPYWWSLSRKVTLEGEAYFEVTKGKTFEVESNLGSTRVLGTSFNIFARGNQYKVHCISGKVEVKSTTGVKQVLLPNQAAKVNPAGEVAINENAMVEHAISWTTNEFVFTAAPLSAVFEEMERQFDIQIVYDKYLSSTYTGNFKRGSSPEEILTIIAKPFGLNVVKISATKYKITQ